MKYYLFMLFTFCLACQAGPVEKQNADTAVQPVSEKKDDLDKLIAKYGNKPLIGLFCIDSSYAGHVSLKKVWYCNLDSSFNVVQTKEYLGKMQTVDREQLMTKLGQWLRNDVLLSSVLDDNLKQGVYFEQLVSEIAQTRPLLKQYLTDPKQYWGSLDANQACKLYYDVLNYLLTLDESRKLVFFKEYFVKACDVKTGE
jgi:hypothetical protein